MSNNSIPLAPGDLVISHVVYPGGFPEKQARCFIVVAIDDHGSAYIAGPGFIGWNFSWRLIKR